MNAVDMYQVNRNNTERLLSQETDEEMTDPEYLAAKLDYQDNSDITFEEACTEYQDTQIALVKSIEEMSHVGKAATATSLIQQHPEALVQFARDLKEEYGESQTAYSETGSLNPEAKDSISGLVEDNLEANGGDQ